MGLCGWGYELGSQTAPSNWSTDADLRNAIAWIIQNSPSAAQSASTIGFSEKKCRIALSEDNIPGEGRARFEQDQNGKLTGKISEMLFNPSKITSLAKLAEKIGHELAHGVQAFEVSRPNGTTRVRGGDIGMKEFEGQLQT